MSIAIAIPVYNGAAYLGEAIESALNQSEKGIELCIVDDASTDTTADVIRRFGDIKAIRLTERLPAPATWNVAVRSTSASHVVVLAHDDILEPSFCQLAHREIEAFPNIDILAFGHQTITNAGEPREQCPTTHTSLPTGALLNNSQFLDEFCARGQMFLPSAVVMSRRIFDAIGGFDERLKVAYDWDFYLRAASAGAKIMLHEKVLCKYRIHETQSVSNFTRRDNGDNDVIFQKMSELSKSLSMNQVRMLTRGMCEFMRQMVSRAVRDPDVTPAEVLKMRESVLQTIRRWAASPVAHAQYIQASPSQLKKKIAWSLMGSTLGISLLRRMLNVKAGG